VGKRFYSANERMTIFHTLLAICRPSGCTVASGVVVVVVCNRSQIRTTKCTRLIFGVSIGLDPGWKCTKGIFDRSKFKVTRDISQTISSFNFRFEWTEQTTMAASGDMQDVVMKEETCRLPISGRGETIDRSLIMKQPVDRGTKPSRPGLADDGN